MGIGMGIGDGVVNWTDIVTGLGIGSEDWEGD